MAVVVLLNREMFGLVLNTFCQRKKWQFSALIQWAGGDGYLPRVVDHADVGESHYTRVGADYDDV